MTSLGLIKSIDDEITQTVREFQEKWSAKRKETDKLFTGKGSSKLEQYWIGQKSDFTNIINLAIEGMYVSPIYLDVIRWFDENIPGILAALESTEVYQPEETNQEDVPSEDDTSYDYEDEQTEDDTTQNSV